MNQKIHNLIISSFLTLAFFAWAEPARASEPEVLLDVVQIVDPAPFIVHTDILPGDSFLHPMTVKNLTGTPQNMVMSLDIDLSQGLVPHSPFELEERIAVTIERVGAGLIILPGPGNDTVATLQELDDTIISLGTIPGLATQEYKINFVFDPTAGNEYQNTKVYFNVAISIDVLEARGSLIIEKENDSVAPEAPGNDVKYTLRVTALHGDVDDVVLTDVPPEGFKYVSGSGTGAPFIHEYASPGVWDLGDMAEGETKTISYRTTISATQDDGLYRDLAYATGFSEGTLIVAADPVNTHPSVDPTNPTGDSFVGTQVAVAVQATPTVTVPEDHENKIVEKTKKKIQYVLGAATLPLTGANGAFLVIALILLMVGIGLVLWGRRLRKANAVSEHATLLKTLLLTLFTGSLLVIGNTASAASLAVKIEKPEAVVNDPNFKIGFVALDIEGRAVSVECYKDSDVLPFATYPLATGGSSGDCQVNAGVLSAPGDYTFFVKAVTTSGGSETVVSETVSVKLVASAPGTPYNYDRDDSSCLNNITFTTAADAGRTVKVELYRSLSTTFTADASTFVTEQEIGSDVSGAFSVAAPGCSNDSYYALRAVDANGFGSGFVGDQDVNVDTHTVTKTKTTTVTTPGTASAGAIAGVSGAPVGEGAVQGAETTADETIGGEGGQPESAVLGEETALKTVTSTLENAKNHPWFTILLAIVVLALGYFGYQYTRGKYDHPTE